MELNKNMKYPQKEQENITPQTDEELNDMPVIPEGEEGTPGDTLDDTTSITEELYQTTWKDEAKAIPLELVTPHEQQIITTYLQDKPITPQQQEELEKILSRYRPAIQKLDPKGTMENLEHNIQLVEDEKAFLELVDEYDEVQVIPFTFYQGDREVRMKFDLYPLLDSDVITSITDNLSLFRDMTDQELTTYNKIQNGEQLTREEIIIRAGLEQKIKKATQENQKQTLVEYLSLQLKFHGRDSSAEDMKQVFQHIPLAYLALLFQEVQQRNHLDDIRLDNVFQEFE